MALIQKAFSDIITFSRSSNATRIGPTGLVEYAPHNLLVRSQEFDNASWTKTNSSVAANSIAAPDGTVTAEKVEETATTGQHLVVQSATVVAASSYNMSVYVKAAERSILRLTDVSSTAAINVDLSSGSILSSSLVTNQQITSVGNGWYRVSATFTSSGTSAQIAVYPLVGGFSSYLGVVGNGFYIWGAQLSVGPYPLDYTPTTSAAVYGPRFDYDPVTLAARGLLIEEQRTNLATYSEQFDNAAWTLNNSTITANSATAPDGTNTADKIVENTSNSAHGLYNTTAIDLPSGTVFTWSVYAKAAGRNWLVIDAYTSAPNRYVWFDLQNGTVGTKEATITATITNVGNGWYRCTATRTSNQATVNGYIGLYAASADNVSIYTGDNTSGILIWGAQLEAGSFATSYIPTVASSVTRSADVASVNTLSPWLNVSQGTFFVQAECLSTAANQTQIALSAGSSFGAGNGLLVRFNTTAIQYGGNSSAIQRNTTIGPGFTQKTAAAFQGTTANLSVNGSAVATMSTMDFTGSGTTTLLFGALTTGGLQQGSLWLKRVAFYPRILADAELIALTA